MSTQSIGLMSGTYSQCLPLSFTLVTEQTD